MRDLNDLACFAAVVRHGGFSPAARVLKLPKSNLSRRIARLEEQLRVRLLERSTRKVSVTDIGAQYYRHCQEMMAAAEAADEAATRLQAQPQGLVRVGCPPGLSRELAEALPRFLAAYPKVRVQFVIASRPLDLVEERIDVAYRVRPRTEMDPNLIVKVLGVSTLVGVASPALLAGRRVPTTPDDLLGLPTLGHTEQLGETSWPLHGPDGKTITFPHEPRLATTDFHILMESVVQGIGVGFVPGQMVREPLGDGRLVRILPDWHAGEGMQHLVFTSRRGILPAVRAMIDFLAEVLRT
ncbi:MAG TPA: LysR family transcriptional regulator [Geminicoccus sp.]|jgi:DNA-binding transcriptional LysR family regulator|uniref:LysR family transcriptional regulator n=1 Tax=Geminicoccus sp. TaxID=2024832 RepID=UPI002E30F180|nr:LysR family transcriptional regulator [Geminicoccus sp.]HEX2526749.1 LysR family transcriptional regulator [Geminicoccus sp.]